MKTNSDTTRTLYLGLDVHKAETVIAILESGRDAEPRRYGSIATTQRAMRRIAKQQNLRLCDLHVCYEASGCGFWIARRLLQMGVRCGVIAPSLIPTRSGDRVKTDKRDAAKLAKNLRSNDLVHVPDAVDEATGHAETHHARGVGAHAAPHGADAARPADALARADERLPPSGRTLLPAGEACAANMDAAAPAASPFGSIR